MATLRTYLKKLKKIRARGTLYEIKFYPNLEYEGKPLHGFCDANSKIIALNSSSPDNELLDTFLHEFLHAVWFETGIGQEEIPEWIEHIFLCGITSDVVNQKALFLRILGAK